MKKEEEVDMLIQHAGTTKANNIHLSVGSAKNILARAVNIPGELIATTASQKDGVITLGGSGSVVVAGNLSAKEKIKLFLLDFESRAKISISILKNTVINLYSLIKYKFPFLKIQGYNSFFKSDK